MGRECGCSESSANVCSAGLRVGLRAETGLFSSFFMQLLINCIGNDIKEKEGSRSNVEGQNIDLYEKRLKRTTGRVINMEEEDHQGQSNSSPIEIDLPESFTDKIINIIQNKSQESPAEFVEDASELESEEYKPAPPPKNNCKKSGKKIEDPYYSKPKKPKGRPRKE